MTNCRLGKLTLILQHKLYKHFLGKFLFPIYGHFLWCNKLMNLLRWVGLSSTKKKHGSKCAETPKVWSSPKVSQVKDTLLKATKLVQKHQGHQERQKWLLWGASAVKFPWNQQFAPENWWLEDEICFGKPNFQVQTVSFRKCSSNNFTHHWQTKSRSYIYCHGESFIAMFGFPRVLWFSYCHTAQTS